MAVPTITSANPGQGPTAGGSTVQVVGTNFVGVTLVTFGDASTAFTCTPPTQLTAFSPPHAAGTVDIRVTNADGTSDPCTEDLFLYVPAVPTVTGVAPPQGPTAGGTTVTITGTNFLYITSVTFGGVSATFTINSGTQITAFSPPGAAGTVDVQVSCSDGTSSATSADRFTYVPAIPTVTGVSPPQGPTAGGTTVTITGTNFLNATAVTFGGISLAPYSCCGPQGIEEGADAGAGPTPTTSAMFVVNSTTQITAFSPAHAAGIVHVQVTNSDGTSAPTAADQFTYQ
jgi:hypothetical protein